MLIDYEKLTYDLSLQYASAKCHSYLEETGDPEKICVNMLEDFAVAYKTLSEFSNGELKFFLHEDE